jgi:hypothetical protein
MVQSTTSVHLDGYEQPGLYLVLKDSTRLTLTRDNIEEVTLGYWMNPDKIPSSVKRAVEFQRCSFCPLKEKEDICDAVRPVLPFLDVVDRYVSFDEVLAIYRSDDGLLHISNTTMQEALRYVSTLSLMSYCQVGRKYRRFYFGIMPLEKAEDFASKVYLNMYWIHKGDKESVDRLISEFHERVTTTTQNQLARLNLICKNDAFLNAFVSTQMVTEFLEMNKDTWLFGEDQLDG